MLNIFGLQLLLPNSVIFFPKDLPERILNTKKILILGTLLNMTKENLTSDEKIIAALSYFWILFLLPLLMKKNNPFCQHHAKQGLILFVFSLIISVLGGIPILGWLIIMPLGWIIVLVLALLGIISALKGNLWEMPILGKYAKKINFNF